MRIFLRFSVGLFRQKTERIEVQPTSTTDEFLDIVAARTGKPLDSFSLTYRQEQVKVNVTAIYVRIIKGWQLSHYDIRPGLTFTVELYDETFNLPQDSMKASRLLNSVLPHTSPFELSRIEESSEEHISRLSFREKLGQYLNFYADEAILQKYLDEQLELLLKYTQRGSLDGVSRVLRDCSYLYHMPALADEAARLKQLTMLNELGQAGWAALHTAVYYEHADIVSFLLIKNCDPNTVTTDGWTPLQLAVAKKNMKIIQLLLDYPSVKVNEVTVRGTALHMAVREELTEIVKLLMQHQANESLKDEDGSTPLDLASTSEIRALLQKYYQQSQEAVDADQELKFINYPPSILKGVVYKESAFYKMKERFLVCNPYYGTLIRYENEYSYPRKPLEVQPLTYISQIKILPKKELPWFMSKDYFYFEIFSQGRVIYGVKQEDLAKQWVKGIFEASVFAMTHEDKHKEIQQQSLSAKVTVLDSKTSKYKVVPKQSSASIRPRNGSCPSKKDSPGFSPLLRQITEFNNSVLGDNRPQKKIVNSEITPFSTSQDSPERLFKKATTSVYIEQSAYEENSMPTESIITPNFEEISSPQFKPRIFEDSPRKSELFTLKPESAKTTTTTMVSQEEAQPQRVKFSSFELLKQIGSGSFGKVFEAKLISTGYIFALKALQKRALAAKQGLKYAISEAEILKTTDHPFIVRLHYTFQTVANLYMCMDYCSRGDLSQYIAEMESVSETDAIFITGQILLALEYLHSKNIVYRDLKPYNMLLCDDGYLKLADFGLSKELNYENTCKTFCGSLAYLSPEMLNSKEVGKHSDIYGMGCILYELLTGEPPYFDQDAVKLQNNIKEGRLKFPQSISSVAKDLLVRLLQRDVSKRITLKETKEHAFFRRLDFELLLQKKIGRIELPIREQPDSDDEDSRINDSKPRFVDYDYPENKLRSRVANYSFAKPAN